MTAGQVIATAAMSLDGFIADQSDAVGPLFDWYGTGATSPGRRWPRAWWTSWP